jgi:hypothetical protein
LRSYVYPYTITFPEPESIIVYRDGSETVLESDDVLFRRLYHTLRENRHRGILKSAVDDQGSLKEGMAIELVYGEAQVSTLQLGGDEWGDREYERLLFPYGGYMQGEALFYRDGKYVSGTIDNSHSELRVWMALAMPGAMP